MKKIFESGFHGDDCWSAQRIHVYQFESSQEYFEFSDMSHNEMCNCCGVDEEVGDVPGALYHKYSFDCSATYAVMYETAVYNV